MTMKRAYRRFWIRKSGSMRTIWTNTKYGNEAVKSISASRTGWYYMGDAKGFSYFESLDDHGDFQRISYAEAKKYAKAHDITKFK